MQEGSPLEVTFFAETLSGGSCASSRVGRETLRLERFGVSKKTPGNRKVGKPQAHITGPWDF